MPRGASLTLLSVKDCLPGAFFLSFRIENSSVKEKRVNRVRRLPVLSAFGPTTTRGIGSMQTLPDHTMVCVHRDAQVGPVGTARQHGRCRFKNGRKAS